MPHRTFAAAREAAQQDPVSFDFAGEHFVCVQRPTLGDTFELMEVPDLLQDNSNLADCALALSKFIARMLPFDDRERWAKTLRTVDILDLPELISLGEWLAEQFTGHPSEPPSRSSTGRRPTGRTSKQTTGGKRASSRSGRSSGSGSSTTA